MKAARKDVVGLSTADALSKLHDEIKKILQNHETKGRKNRSKENEILPSYAVFITLLVIFGLIYTTYYLTAVLVFAILILNVTFVIREEKLKQSELSRKTELILEDIKLGIILSKDWTVLNYPHLCSPLSPCISLVWTYRDNELVNIKSGLPEEIVR